VGYEFYSTKGLFGKKKVEGKTKDADAWYNKGKALQNLGRYEEAIRCYDKVIEINPEYDGVFDSKLFAMDKLKEQEQQEELLKTNKTINDIQTALQKAKKLDINTRVEEKQLDTVKEKITQGSLSVALEFANKCKNSLEQKINEAAERSAKQSIELAYSKIKEAEKLGINVPDAKDLHRKALSEFDNREYEKAKELAEEAKRIALKRKSEYDSAFKSISEAELAIENAKEFGCCDTSEAEGLSNKARAGFEDGNYAQAISDARKSEEIAKEIKEESYLYSYIKESQNFTRLSKKLRLSGNNVANNVLKLC